MSADATTSTAFRMPSLGADMESGVLLEWLVRPGDTVHKGDIVAVVDTSKAAVEIECFTDGVIGSLLVEPGTRVPVGDAIALIEGRDRAVGGSEQASCTGTHHPVDTGRVASGASAGGAAARRYRRRHRQRCWRAHHP